jgi:hypothetical protein
MQSPATRRLPRRRQVLLLAAGLIAALVAATVVPWPAPCPVQVELVAIEASGLLDDDGSEPMLVTVRVSNLGPSPVSIEGVRPTSVRVGPTWVRLEVDHWLGKVVPGTAARITPGTARDELIVVPAKAEACRVWLKYDRFPRSTAPLSELFKQMIVKHLGARLRTHIATTPWLAKRLWPDPFNRRQHSPRWTDLTVELAMPRAGAIGSGADRSDRGGPETGVTATTAHNVCKFVVG